MEFVPCRPPCTSAPTPERLQRPGRCLFTQRIHAELRSKDGKWLALNKTRTHHDTDIHRYNVETKELKHITPPQGDVRFQASTFDPASTALYYLTDEGSEFTRVARYELATGKREDVERADWDVMYTSFSRKGGYRVTAINEDGRTSIRVHDVKAGKPLALPQLPAGDITSVHVSNTEKRMRGFLDTHLKARPAAVN